MRKSSSRFQPPPLLSLPASLQPTKPPSTQFLLEVSLPGGYLPEPYDLPSLNPQQIVFTHA